VDDCTTPARAKGLCAKHRMRQLRTGDPTMVRRPGRPKIAHLEQLRELFEHDWSARTIARFWRASRIIAGSGGQDALMAAVQRCTRPNGTINVAAFEREADRAIMQWVHDHPDHEDKA
jgi:hypothetical protein